MNCLVIGGCGLVGSHIVTMLKTDDYFNSVKSFDISPAADIPGDISNNISNIISACRLVDIVIHCASPPHGRSRELYELVNVQGTRNVIQACREQGVKRLVFTSSASVVYNGQHLLNADETLPYCKVHIDAYNETKAIAEAMVLEANDASLSTIALRPAGIFGPGDMQASYAIYEAAKNGKHKFQVGHNSTLFDMTFVDNVAYGHLLAAKNMNADNCGEAYNITNDCPVFWFDFAKAIYSGLGYVPSLQYQIPFWMAFPLAYVSEIVGRFIGIQVLFTVFRMTFLSTNRVYSIEKAKSKLGYYPIVGMEQGIEQTIAWLKGIK